jgi:trk system potassium uptake protein TrkH
MACAVAGITVMALLMLLQNNYIFLGVAIAINLLNYLVLPRRRTSILASGENWWVMFINHPGRILFTTFFSLCLAGSLLLIIPASTEKGTIAVIDSVFTAVSAVCVTGLIVLDTPHDFSFLGQLFLLILIQLGGLGIMSITTVALHVMGRRLSLRHEKLLASMTDTSHQDVVRSLGTILKFTFAVEATGALLLTFSFYLAGDQAFYALWRGVFTAVSAFCNAGFALQSDSLIPYQTNPFVLYIVSILIVFGGIAPATSLAIPRWIKRKPIPIPARIALLASIVLLAVGMIAILIFEWNGVLAGLPIIVKIQNAWFQSVTLRTAGFNSVDIASISNSTFLVMISFMFIGGSPGGAAGGIKTTTIAILAMTFLANVANQEQITTQHRRLHPGTVYRAITVIIAGGATWFLIVMMLEMTQAIPFRDLIFEATSAIGTVGLSTGATSMLDEIGKVIVIIAMFVGRIGPISLFMLLSSEQPVNDTRYPEERLSIT